MEKLRKLLISGEDHRFIYHIGFDFIAIIRAVRNRVLNNKIEGASTIDQQLVRVLTNDFDRTLRRKIQEILLSTTLTSIVPKNALPLIYLNIAYYGSGMLGLQQTIKKMNIADISDISIETAAEIVSRIKYPQPSSFSEKQTIKIENRKKHLIQLYNNHCKRRVIKIYG